MLLLEHFHVNYMIFAIAKRSEYSKLLNIILNFLIFVKFIFSLLLVLSFNTTFLIASMANRVSLTDVQEVIRLSMSLRIRSDLLFPVR